MIVRGRGKLAQVDIRLATIIEIAGHYLDIVILDGHRGKQKQNELFENGQTKLVWPHSKHNKLPSLAIDFAPYSKRYGVIIGTETQIKNISDKLGRSKHYIRQWVREQYTLYAGFILGIGAGRGEQLRWGGDWNRNFDTLDNNFDDLGHIEILE